MLRERKADNSVGGFGNQKLVILREHANNAAPAIASGFARRAFRFSEISKFRKHNRLRS